MALDIGKIEGLGRFSQEYRVPWIYPGLLEYGGMNMIFGVSRAQKSMLASYLMGCALLGKPAFGQIEVEHRPQKALLIYGEGRLEAEIARLLRVTASLGCSKADLDPHILTVGKNSGMMLSNPQDGNVLLQYLNAHHVDLVYFDSLMNFNTYDENDNSLMASVGRALGKLLELHPERSALVVHHIGKGSGEGRTVGQHARGASSLPAVMDCNLMLDKKASGHVLHTEDKYHGGQDKFFLRWDPATWLWSLREEEDGETEAAERMVALHTEHPEYSATALAKLSGIRQATAFPLAKRIVGNRPVPVPP